ncbi:flagellar basal body rod protein FlgF [Stenotrophomonas sp. W1S232]|jgi:fagellar hook-basal body proteins|uniref:Flagellar basal-body rod protein FlgF n=1 Tax=Stenotrophomonas koreensis TaxID=266128 RepID=A0A7W3V1V6_9GAMM|nr:flagellar basal body rod protein FlgF [Stenotrophomonas koreensis]MBB1117968.1 flagellar basal body rod protein FlgF [Stenotrophomonas koreensis]
MDKSLYVAMTGARASLQAQATVSHNLANANTAGFKQVLANTSPFPVTGEGWNSRIDTIYHDSGFNPRAGSQQVTGNALDLSLAAGNWLAVQGSDGNEGYTRNGSLQLTANGQLVTSDGHPVMDVRGQPVAVPPFQAIEVGADGTLSIIPQGEGPQTLAEVARLRVVSADNARLVRGLDGLMRNTTPAQPFAAATGSALQSGVLEGSNVDATGALVQMINLQRQYEMQVKVIKHGDENAQSANSLLRLNG